MPASLTIFLFSALSLLIGATLCWLYSRQKLAASLAQLETRLKDEHSATEHGLALRLATAEEKNSHLAEVTSTLATRESLITTLQQTNSEAGARLAALEMQITEERQQAVEKLTLLQDAQHKLTETFQALSAQALAQNNQSFLDLAKTTLGQFQEKASGELSQKQQAITELLKPVRESLASVDTHIRDLEKTRAGAYEALISQVKSLSETQQQLRGETSNLVRALHSPVVRGRWGEIQLRRVVELAGMIEHCDFYEQTSTNTEDGRLRPDMLVKMPGGKSIVVDAKAAISAYLESLEATEPAAKLERLDHHAFQVRDHIKRLGSKDYSEQFEEAPEFVVLFLPGEMFFSAALERDPTLIEFGAERRVILATPTTLIALLRAVHFGWRQEKLAENAQVISDLGRELYDRLATLGDNMGKLGRHLDSAVDAYNKTAGSLESRVLVSARKFKDLQAAHPDRELKTPEQIDHTTRQLQAPELQFDEKTLGS